MYELVQTQIRVRIRAKGARRCIAVPICVEERRTQRLLRCATPLFPFSFSLFFHLSKCTCSP